jgi:hypothetical protein
MIWSPNLVRATRYEQERIDAMMKLGCVCCASLGIPYANVECDHITEGGKRLGPYYTIPVCPGHHRGEWTQLQRELIPSNKLVAICDGSKRFNAVYGSRKDLWKRVQTRLHLPALWPVSKILPPRIA